MYVVTIIDVHVKHYIAGDLAANVADPNQTVPSEPDH